MFAKVLPMAVLPRITQPKLQSIPRPLSDAMQSRMTPLDSITMPLLLLLYRVIQLETIPDRIPIPIWPLFVEVTFST